MSQSPGGLEVVAETEFGHDYVGHYLQGPSVLEGDYDLAAECDGEDVVLEVQVEETSVGEPQHVDCGGSVVVTFAEASEEGEVTLERLDGAVEGSAVLRRRT